MNRVRAGRARSSVIEVLGVSHGQVVPNTPIEEDCALSALSAFRPVLEPLFHAVLE